MMPNKMFVEEYTERFNSEDVFKGFYSSSLEKESDFKNQDSFWNIE